VTPPSTLRAGLLAFLTAFITLFVQILVHRIVSAKLVNNFAFLVISLTMLGFACSGVILSRWLPRFLEDLGEALCICAVLFTATLVGATCVFYRIDPGTAYAVLRPGFVVSFFEWLPFALLFAIPFVFCGLILGTLLSAPQFSARSVYASDLAGSALGAFAVIPAIRYVGVETSLLAAAGTLLVGTPLLVSARRGGTRLALGLSVIGLLIAATQEERVFHMRYPSESALSFTQLPGSRWKLELMVWDPVARIEVMRMPPPDADRDPYPCLIGGNARFLSRFKRLLTQNNYAFTYAVDYDGKRDSLTGIEETIYSAAYEASSVTNPNVCVIGVGGGFDILTALNFDASRVTGVEINSATVDILTRYYRDYFRHWVDDPRLRLVGGEGRHFLATHPDRFDVLQLSGVDSYSGTAAAAHVFSENYLYTAEAFDLYLSRLTDSGIINMMRLEYKPPREMLRALVTAVGALRRAGSPRPAEHVIMLTAAARNFTALLVKKTPFTQAEERRVAEWAQKSPYFSVSASPSVNAERANIYQLFLSLGDPRLEILFRQAYPFDVSPAEDDRPFFFRYSRWNHLWSSRPGVEASVPIMEVSVLMLLAVIGVVGALCVLLPLGLFAIRGLRTAEAGRFGVFFASIGIGYMAIEMALLQKFGLFLGHPNYALSVVLAALLLATGVGSLLSERILQSLGQIRLVAYVLTLLILIEYGFVFSRLPSLVAWPFALKVMTVFALVSPIGVCLGTFMPSALEHLKVRAPGYAPWAWGINGIFSVLAPVISVGFSMTWGINALLLAAIPVYLVAGFAFPDSASARGRS